MSNDPNPTRTFSLDEVQKHNTAKDAWVAVDGKVYDITDFVQRHPGGPEIVVENLGADVSETMNIAHNHSDAAYKILTKFQIGVLGEGQTKESQVPKFTVSTVDKYKKEMETKFGDKVDKLIDFTKPMVTQVEKLGEDYDTWTHIPHYLKESAPFFDNPLLERITHTKWWYLPIFWTPVFCYFMSNAAQSESNILVKIFLFLFGISIWCAMEYSIHRWAFHMKATTPAFIRFHFTVHGSHHLMPMDKDRLLFPPLVAFFAAVIPIYNLLTYLFGHANGSLVGAGTLLSYVVYDLTHYYIHHGNPFGPFKYLKRIHTYHHYKEPNWNFGISFQAKLLDYIIGTHRAPEEDLVETK